MRKLYRCAGAVDSERMDRPVARSVRDALIAARERVGLRQKDAAAKAGLSQSQVSRFESGEQEPTFDELAALAVVYGQPMTEFLTGAPAPDRAADPWFERMCRVWARMTEEQHEHWVGFLEVTVPKQDRPKGRTPRRRLKSAKRIGAHAPRPRADESDE
jgi:transcriptional regulator with XRE-family HTH domain